MVLPSLISYLFDCFEGLILLIFINLFCCPNGLKTTMKPIRPRKKVDHSIQALTLLLLNVSASTEEFTIT